MRTAMLIALAAAGGIVNDAHRVEAKLNALTITFDAHTGAVLRLAYPRVGVLLDATPDRASLLDLAYPIPDFEPLRLAARYSTGARIEKAPDSVTIHWDSLGASRTNYALAGHVEATVHLRAMPDGESIGMTAEIVNRSPVHVRQVLFPDFLGLTPSNGEAHTHFRACGFSSTPFRDLAMTEARESAQFMDDFASLAIEHSSGGLHNSDMVLRWFDFGGLKGGLSLFERAWGWDPPLHVRLQRSEVEPRMRISVPHYIDLAPDSTWHSPEFVLTPHEHGWAAGAAPFREWVREHHRREVPVPERVRDSLGFRSVWMCQNRPSDPKDRIFRFADLPKIAKESKIHGLDSMVVWAWSDFFRLPLPGPYPHLGTEADMAAAARECAKLGVDLAPFISVLIQNAASAPRYGARVEGAGGWTYHTELIPRFNPPYAAGSATVQVGPTNTLWHKDVLAAAAYLRKLGMPSLCWDQTWTTDDPEPNQLSLLRQIQRQARTADPEASLGGEELFNFELDSDVLDYTWNWRGYADCVALTSVLPSPRVNCGVSLSPLVAKLAFADSLYLNVMPRKPESINGTDWIAARPALSRALKQCAALRKRYLRYFTRGTLIGDCLLKRPAAGLHLSAYALPDRALAVLVNLGPRRSISLELQPTPWLAKPAPSYVCRVIGADGRLVASAVLPQSGRLQLPPLDREGLAVLELFPVRRAR